MSTDRDTSRIVRSWLEEGATELPDRVLDAVLDQLPTTPQRRTTWWPARRISEMKTPMRIALAAAAVVVVAFIGYQLLPGSNVGAGNPAATEPDEGQAIVRDWIDAVNRGDGEAMSRLMADEVETADGQLARAEVVQYVLDAWCPMTIDTIVRVDQSYEARVAFRDNEDGTCTDGAPGTTGSFIVRVEDGEITRIP